MPETFNFSRKRYHRLVNRGKLPCKATMVVAGRITLAIMFILAPLLERLEKSPENLRREAIFCSFAVVSLGASLRIPASTLNLKSGSVYLSRPTNIEAG